MKILQCDRCDKTYNPNAQKKKEYQVRIPDRDEKGMQYTDAKHYNQRPVNIAIEVDDADICDDCLLKIITNHYNTTQ